MRMRNMQAASSLLKWLIMLSYRASCALLIHPIPLISTMATIVHKHPPSHKIPRYLNPQYPNNMKPKPIFNLSLIAVAAGMPLVANAVTWDGSDSTAWSTGTNWVGDIAPVAAEPLEFSGTGIPNQPSNNDIAALTSFAGIAFTNDGTAGISDQAFTLGGNSITLGGNITTAALVEGAIVNTIDFDIVLDANRAIQTNPGHDINITGDISGAFTLTVGRGGNTNDGLVTLSGNNTHTATALTNRKGRVRAESNTALGGSLNMPRGSSLEIAAGIDLTAPGGINVPIGGTPPQSISLIEDGIATASINAVTGVINNNTSQALSFNVGEDDTLTVDGILSGAGQTRKVGLGTLVLTNPANSYTGQMRIFGGILSIGGTGILGDATSSVDMTGGTLDLAGTTQTIDTLLISAPGTGGDTIQNGTISATTAITANNGVDAIISANLSGAANLAKSGAGILTLNGTNTYTGTTTSTAGSIVAASSAALPGYTTPGNVIFDGGTIGVQVSGSGWTPAEVDDLLANATKTSGGFGIDTTNGDFTQSAAFDFAVLGLTKLGTNSLTLDKVNTYAGSTTLSEGTLNLDNASALGATSGATFFIDNGTTIDNTSGGAITLANNPSVILPGDGFVFGGSNDLNLGTGPVLLNLPPNNATRVITLNGTGSTLTLGDSTSPSRGGNTNIQVDGVGNTLVFNSLGLNESVANRTNEWSGSANVTVLGGLLDDGGQRFTYSGTGTFTIGGASTYIGNTTVTSGTLALAAGGSLADETSVFINGGVIDLAAGVSDAIASLVIVGVNGDAALPDGTYGNTASGADNGGLGVGALDAYLTGSGVFTITTATAFETWAGGVTFDADTNGDGVDNGLAWILGAADADVDALSLLPDATVSSGDLDMTFTILDPIAPAKLYVEYTNDLTGLWTQAEVPATTSTVGAVDFVITPGAGTLSVEVTIPASEASVDGALFGRLSATEE